MTLGAVGMTFAYGVSGLWYAPGCLLGYLVNVYLVAPRLRPLSEANGSVTLTDVITRRWGDPRNVLRVTATTIILLCMMGYVAAQMTAAGKAFSSSLGLEGRTGYLLGIVIGAVVMAVGVLMLPPAATSAAYGEWEDAGWLLAAAAIAVAAGFAAWRWVGRRGELTTKDKRFVYVDSYARWRITDPLKFFQRLRDERGQARLLPEPGRCRRRRSSSGCIPARSGGTRPRISAQSARRDR